VSDAVLPGSSFNDVEISGDRQGIIERNAAGRIYDDVTFTFYVDSIQHVDVSLSIINDGNWHYIVGFANWSLRGTPYVGTAFLEFIYSRRYNVAEKLLLQFEQFAKANNAPYLMADIITLGKVSKHFKTIAKKHGYNYIENPYQSYIFRK